MGDGKFVLKGHGSNVVGSFGSGSLVQDMPTAYSNPSGGNAWVNVGTPDTALELSGATATVSCWVKSIYDNTSFPDNNHAVSKYIGGTGKRGYRLGINSDGGGLMYWAVGLPGAGGAVQATQDVSTYGLDTTQWFHMAGTFDAGVMKLYINGELATEEDHSASTVEVSGNATVPFEIGSYETGSRLWYGNMRDVRIWNSSLDITAIQEVFKDVNMTGGTHTSSLQGWWKMENESLTDSSTNSNNGAQSGTAVWDKSAYNLNQIGSGSISGSVTVSGGTWNLKNNTYISPTGTNNTNANYIQLNNDQQYDGSRSYAMWFYLGATGNTQIVLDNYLSNAGTRVFINGGTTSLYLRLNNTNVINFAANENEWNHLVWTIDETNNLAKGYLNGIEVTSAANDRTYGTVNNMRIGAQTDDDYPTNDGNYISEYAYYTSVLTPEQIDLLYKGQWIGRPETWLKMDEGTGTTITNHGSDGATATLTGVSSNLPVWVNPDYEIEMYTGGTPFMIEEDATLSAPRGNLVLSGTTVNQPTYQIEGIYTHNNGTMIHRNAVDVYWRPSDISKSGVNTFHKFKIEGSKTQWSRGSWNVEDSIHLEGIMRLYANSTYSEGHTLTLGTTGSQGYVSGSSYMQAMTTVGTPAGSIIQGASKLYPALLSGTHSSYKGTLAPYRSVQLGNLQFDGKVTNEASMDSPVVTLIDDVYFKGGYDAHNGETLVTTNQRAQFGANLDMESGVTFVGSGALLICDDKIKTDGATVYNSGTSVICGHAGTSTIRFNSGDWENLMYNPTGGGVTFDTNANVANNLIVAGGYYDMQNVHLSGDGVGTLQIVGGAEFKGGDGVTHKITDTFNSRGGLLGTSALEFNGSSESAANASATTWGFGSSFSIELWFKTSFNGSSCLLDMAESSGNDNRIQVLQTASEMAFKVWNSGGSSFQIGTTAFTINPDDGKWHHLAFTSDGSTQKIYYDGRLAGEASHTIARDADPTMKLTIGMHATLGSHYSGYMDELRFFSDVRTESELRTDMFQGGTLANSGALVARYKFDEGENTTLANSEGTTARNLTASGDGVWIPAGTFSYETCTLEFDNVGGTCNLYAPLSGGPTPAVSGLTITSGTTMVINNPGRDFYCYGPLVNSGTTTASHNFQYRNRAMPIVGPNSDLKLGGKIFYYFSDGTANYVASGAGADYYQMRPGTTVFMQGDFDVQNDIIQSGGELHLNGYTANTNSIMNYGGGDIYAEPGSSIAFDSTDGFEKSFGASPTDMLFAASGEAAAMFNWNEAANTGTDNISTAAQHAAGGITLVAWVKNQDGYNKDFFIGRGARDGLGLWNNDRQLAMGIVIGGGDPDRLYSSNAVPGDGEWVHLAGVYDPSDSGNELKIYVSGALVASGATTSTGAISYESSAWLIGGDGDSERYMHGSIADVRIYSGSALSAANIATLYNGGINPAVCTSGAIYADSDNALGATGWWKLGGTSTGTLDLTDYAGSNNGTNNGGRTGFVTISSSATPYNPINNLYPASVTLRNVYMSGSKDIIAGQRRESSAGYMAVPTQVIKTEGTVVLD